MQVQLNIESLLLKEKKAKEMQGPLPAPPAAASRLNIMAAALLPCCLQVQMNIESLLLKKRNPNFGI
jgi:hypothetical protein